jgi:hypothetical protein
LDFVNKEFGNAKGAIQKSNGFNCKVHPLNEFLKFREDFDKQITYISESVSEYKQITSGNLSDYFFAISKFLQKNKSHERNSNKVKS